MLVCLHEGGESESHRKDGLERKIITMLCQWNEREEEEEEE